MSTVSQNVLDARVYIILFNRISDLLSHFIQETWVVSGAFPWTSQLITAGSLRHLHSPCRGDRENWGVEMRNEINCKL
jgi:hypothetical protein